MKQVSTEQNGVWSGTCGFCGAKFETDFKDIQKKGAVRKCPNCKSSKGLVFQRTLKESLILG